MLSHLNEITSRMPSLRIPRMAIGFDWEKLWAALKGQPLDEDVLVVDWDGSFWYASLPQSALAAAPLTARYIWYRQHDHRMWAGLGSILGWLLLTSIFVNLGLHWIIGLIFACIPGIIGGTVAGWFGGLYIRPKPLWVFRRDQEGLTPVVPRPLSDYAVDRQGPMPITAHYLGEMRKQRALSRLLRRNDKASQMLQIAALFTLVAALAVIMIFALIITSDPKLKGEPDAPPEQPTAIHEEWLGATRRDV